MLHKEDEHIVTVSWLAKYVNHPDIVIADCRYDLTDATAGRKAYERGHIPGAIFFDLALHLSAKATASDVKEERPGGRHPLPSPEQLVEVFSQAGIDKNVTVVCYDAERGGRAGRLWWLLRYMGHKRVVMLDGGFEAWKKAGHATVRTHPTPVPRRFQSQLQHDMVATMNDVRHIVASGKGVIIDSRAPERFRGANEPLDARAGHIPGAYNVPWDVHLTAEGTFVSTHDMMQNFVDAGLTIETTKKGKRIKQANSGDIVVHCGSGITGCVNVLALARCGISHVKLYVGGWSEWSTYPDNPIASIKE